MANIIQEQRLVDSTKRALIKYVLISDGSNEANTTLVDVSSLAFALNANGYIMSSNTDIKSKYNTTIKRIYAAGAGAGTIRLQWQGASNSYIAAFGTGGIDIDFEARSEPTVIKNPETNSTGDILISTAGLGSGTVYTILVDLRKDNKDFDAGQTADPAAFNSGPYKGGL